VEGCKKGAGLGLRVGNWGRRREGRNRWDQKAGGPSARNASEGASRERGLERGVMRGVERGASGGRKQTQALRQGARGNSPPTTPRGEGAPAPEEPCTPGMVHLGSARVPPGVVYQGHAGAGVSGDGGEGARATVTGAAVSGATVTEGAEREGDADEQPCGVPLGWAREGVRTPREGKL